MIFGLTPLEMAPSGAVEVCVSIPAGTPGMPDVSPMRLTASRVLPYGGTSPYLTFPWGVPYRVTVYDAASFPGSCPTGPDATAVFQGIVEPFLTDEEDAAHLGEFHTGALTGWTAGGCAVAGLSMCPPVQLGIDVDDYRTPTAGDVRVTVVNGASQIPVPVDVCVVDLAAPSAPAIALGTNIASRGTSTTSVDPIAGSASTAIQLRAHDPAAEAPCGGTPLPPPSMGLIGQIPTPEALRASAMTNIPATYDADTYLWLFIFPVGGGEMRNLPLPVPWVDSTVDYDSLF
jgi:hypothetical protein